MSEPAYIPVTADTQARFFAQADELNLSSDAYVRFLLSLTEFDLTIAIPEEAA